MNNKSFSHRMIITNENGKTVASEITTNSLSSRSQRLYIEKHFKLLNTALGLPSDTKLSYNTSDPERATEINEIIKKIMNESLTQ